MTYDNLITWLLENGNSIIRWRTYNELLNGSNQQQVLKYKNEVLLNEHVKKYFDLFITNALDTNTFNYSKSIHGSGHTFFENYVGKLYDFGINKSFFTTTTVNNYIKIIINDYKRQPKDRQYAINQMLMSISLLGITDKFINNKIQNRLNEVTDFIHQYGYNYYITPKNILEIPGIWRNRKIVNPEFYKNHAVMFPFFYDILGFVSLINNNKSKTFEKKIDVVLDFILHDNYYKYIENGNGIMKMPNGRYYSIGWSIHIPGFIKKNNTYTYTSKTLFRALLFSNFNYVSKFDFFGRVIKYLETFKTSYGTYIFPKELIPVKKLGYWILGINLGLGMNRRRKNALEIESTFYMLKLKKNLGIF